MFVRTKTRWSWLSHLFSRQLGRVFFIPLFLNSLAHADVVIDPIDPGFSTTQLPRDKTSPIDTAPFKPPIGETDWKEFFRNVHGSYNLSFMGPRIAGSGTETYNIFVPDVAPLQLSHTWKLGAQVNPDFQLGFSVNSIQNISDNIRGNTGIIRG